MVPLVLSGRGDCRANWPSLRPGGAETPGHFLHHYRESVCPLRFRVRLDSPDASLRTRTNGWATGHQWWNPYFDTQLGSHHGAFVRHHECPLFGNITAKPLTLMPLSPVILPLKTYRNEDLVPTLATPFRMNLDDPKPRFGRIVLEGHSPIRFQAPWDPHNARSRVTRLARKRFRGGKPMGILPPLPAAPPAGRVSPLTDRSPRSHLDQSVDEEAPQVHPAPALRGGTGSAIPLRPVPERSAQAASSVRGRTL